jgi:glutamine synthetase
MHMHMSISKGKTNLFEDKTDRRGLKVSKLGYQFTAGLLKHAPALAALCCPTVNSYKRLVVGRSLTGATWAPAYISYGNGNRSSMVRGPGGRIELRLPDAACNPYLATAASSPPAWTGSTTTSTRASRQRQPVRVQPDSSCAKPASASCRRTSTRHIDALERDELMMDALGPSPTSSSAQAHGVDRVLAPRSDWEVSSYLEFF